VQRAEAMLKARMISSRINEVCYAKLFDIPKPLEPWMLNEVKYEITRDAYKTINRIVNNFSLVNQVTQLGNFTLQK
jgi:hypothetical protein